MVAPVGLRLAKRTYVLTRAPFVPDVLFRCFLQFSLLFGLEYEWADVENPKYRTMVQAYKRRVAEEPALGRSLLSTARHFPFEQLGPAFAAAGDLLRPVLVVWGDGDRTCPCQARDVRRLVPRADVVVVRGARHCVYTEFVGESARAVVRPPPAGRGPVCFPFNFCDQSFAHVTCARAPSTPWPSLCPFYPGCLALFPLCPFYTGRSAFTLSAPSTPAGLVSQTSTLTREQLQPGIRSATFIGISSIWVE